MGIGKGINAAGLMLLVMGLLVGVPRVGQAQKMNFKTYSVSDGLPQAQVHDIAQTQDGYIWMSTYGGGLVKFDGTNFVTYTKEDGLKSNTVEHVLVDSNDKLWLTTANGGVTTFRGDSLVDPIQDDALNSYDLTALSELNDKRKWFGTYQGGVFIYDGTSLTRLTTKDGLLSNTVWNFFEDAAGKIWMSTSKGISIYDGTSFTNYTFEDGLSGTAAYDIIERNNGKKWIATTNGITVWDGKEFRPKKKLDGQDLGSVYDLLVRSDGSIWIATEKNGLFVQQGETVNHYTKENGLSSNFLYRMIEDADNNIWIGTDENGVNVFKERGFTFYDRAAGLGSNMVFSIYRDNSNIMWMGTGQGLESFDGQSFTNYSLPQDYDQRYIWNITGLPNGDKLIGMPDNTLMRFDGQTFSSFSETYGLGKLYVYDFYLDNNKLWIGSETGLYIVDLQTKQHQHYTESDGLASDRVFYIYEDSESTMWLGTGYGLSIFDDNEFSNYRVHDGLVDNQIHYITEATNGSIWLGTGGGISEFDPGKNNHPTEINNFDESDGMRLVNTHFIWFDDQGYLWQGTNGGLHMLDVSAFSETGEMPVTHYSLSNTGLGREFNYQALSKASPSEIWMGSMKGAVQFNPNRTTRNQALPKLNLTNIKVNGLPVDWQQQVDSVTYHNGAAQFVSATFPSGANTYEFEFQGLSYLNPENVQYRYKLNGFDDNWRSITKDNSATYTNLSPGEYSFVVEAKTGGGTFSDQQVNYSFAIAPPFWDTYWFYALVGCSIIGLVYGLIQYRVHKLENKKLQELVDEQTLHLTEALEEKEVLIKEIHHRVKNNLAVISGLLELQQGNAENDFARRVLSESQRRVQSISMIHEKLYQNERLAEIDFERYVRELVKIISYSFSYPNKEITVTVDIDDIKLGVDQGIPCGLILNELVSNAYEHAFKEQDEGTIAIQITEKEGDLIAITVADDGIGMAENTEPQTSDTLGFTLIQTLSQQLEADLDVEDNNPGSRFVITFQKESPSPKIPA